MDFIGNQLDILEEQGHLAITASPGSGKTTVIAEKIRKGIQDSNSYFGAIAVSFTNKASNNLRDKCGKGGLRLDNCYFGTIDKFCISEILFPFAPKISEANNFTVLKWNDLVLKDIPNLILHPNEPYENHRNSTSIEKILNSGYIMLEIAAEMSLHVLYYSSACKKFLTSKYTHIFIDEYQDCNVAQHRLLLFLFNLGLTCIAAGDIEQSIFKFAKKDSKYLRSLTKSASFRHIEMTDNFRSHTSIVEYCNNFRKHRKGQSFERRNSHVVHINITGDENDIIRAINSEIATNNFTLSKHSVGIFYTSNEKCLRASKSIKNSIYNQQTPIEESSSIHCYVFQQLLYSLLSKDPNSYAFASRFFHPENEKSSFIYIRRNYIDIADTLQTKKIYKSIDKFYNIAKILTGENTDKDSKAALEKTLIDQNYISSFYPISNGTINIMNYHKAKGLEFDIVFMPDMYKYILPNINREIEQEENLFYVGISRPKTLLFLMSSTLRHRANGSRVSASESEFLTRNAGHRFFISYEEYCRYSPIRPEHD